MKTVSNGPTELPKNVALWTRGESGFLIFDEFFNCDRVKYSYRTSGFLRCNIAGIRFVWIDTAKYHACYSDRTHGLKIGRFIVRVSRV